MVRLVLVLAPSASMLAGIALVNIISWATGQFFGTDTPVEKVTEAERIEAEVAELSLDDKPAKSKVCM